MGRSHLKIRGLSDMDEHTDLEHLIAHAGPRPEPDALTRARVEAAVRAEWQAVVGREQGGSEWRRRRTWLALAAVVVAAIAVPLEQRLGESPVDRLLVAEGGGLKIDGAMAPAHSSWIEVDAGAGLEATTPVRLRLRDGLELRVRAGTRLTWRAGEVVELEHGAVYVDSHGVQGFQLLAGTHAVQHVGTRYLVERGDRALRVAVRSGTVVVRQPVVARDRSETGIAPGMPAAGPGVEVRAGSMLRVLGEQISRVDLAPDAPDWNWIHAVRPAYGESNVRVLLDLIADELGKAVVWSDPAARRIAETARIEGQLDDLTPTEAFDVVLASSGLEVRPQSDGSLQVRLQSIPPED